MQIQSSHAEQGTTPVSGRTGSRRALALCAVLLVGCGVRFANLGGIEPFIDEGSHLYGTTQFDFEPLLTRIAHGKLLGYLVHFPALWFSNPLLAARAETALLGIASCLGLYICVKSIAGFWPGLTAALIWSAFPIVTFHDRLALHDPIAACLVIWSAVLATRATRSGLARPALLAGLLAGCAALTKLHAALAALCFIFPILPVFGRRAVRRQTLAFAIGMMLAASPLAVPWLAGAGHDDFFGRVLNGGGGESSLGGIVTNAGLLWDWCTRYGSIWLICILAVCVVETAVFPSRAKVMSFAGWALMLGAAAVGLKVLFSRYLLPFLPALVVWFSISITDLLQRLRRSPSKLARSLALLVTILAAGCAVEWISFNAHLIVDPIAAGLPEDDEFQYLTGWPSGTGLRATAGFLARYRQSDPAARLLITGGPGTQGRMGLPLVMPPSTGLTIKPAWVVDRAGMTDIMASARERPVLVLMEPPYYQWPLAVFGAIKPAPALLWNYHRPHSSHGFRVYRIARGSLLGDDPGPGYRLAGYWDNPK